MATTRVTSSAGLPVAAELNVIQWNGVAPVPPEFTALGGGLTTLFATIFVQAFDAHNIPVPGADVEVTVTIDTANIVENAAATGGVVSGFGTSEGVVVAGFFGGIKAVGAPAGTADLANQSSITHLFTTNSRGMLALKFLAQPTVADFTKIHISSGSAQLSFTPTLT